MIRLYLLFDGKYNKSSVFLKTQKCHFDFFLKNSLFSTKTNERTVSENGCICSSTLEYEEA